MLNWFANEYAPSMNLSLDMSEKRQLWKTTIEGSLAYATEFCSEDGENCALSTQLHNRPDYSTQISAVRLWRITASFRFLRERLAESRNATRPILINVRQFASQFGEQAAIFSCTITMRTASAASDCDKSWRRGF